MGTDRPKVSWVALLAGFAVIYFVWGSTYLAIKIAVESFPPFLMAGNRFLISVTIMGLWSWLRGDPLPTLRQWRNASAAGILLFVGGNGGVSYSQQFIPSGLAALVVATLPAWLALFDWLAVSGRQPRALELIGIGLGLGGVSMLTMVGHKAVGASPVGIGIVVGASAAWAAGSLFARGSDVPRSPVQVVALEMLAGGVVLVLLGLASGEADRFNADVVSNRSLIAYAYLILAGLVALPVYTWLLTVTSPALVGTYAFVNPVVAVMLGWAVENELLTDHTAGAAVLVMLGVALITWPKKLTPLPTE